MSDCVLPNVDVGLFFRNVRVDEPRKIRDYCGFRGQFEPRYLDVVLIGVVSLFKFLQFQEDLELLFDPRNYRG